MKNLYSVIRFTSLVVLFTFFAAAFVEDSNNFQVGAKEISKTDKKIENSERVPVYNEQTLVDVDKPHTLVGAYYNVNDSSLKSKLMLNNKGLIPIEVEPVLYGVGGAMLQVPPITVDAMSHQFVDIADWAGLGGSGFSEGNLELFHRGKDMIIGSQIHLVDESKSLGFEYKIKEKGQFDSRQLETVWWNPSNNSEMDVVLTNTSEDLLTITANLTKKPAVSSSPQTIVLQPHETKVLNVRDDFNQGSAFANKKLLGLSLTHDGVFDALLAWTMIKDEATGYSSTAIFENPQRAQSKQFHGAGLQLGKIGNDKLKPIVIVRNTSEQQVGVKVTVSYTKNNGNKKKVKLDRITLAPKEIKKVDMTEVKQLRDVKVAGIKIKHTGKKGSLVTSAQSVSQSKTQVFKTLLWNVNAQHNSTGKYPFFIEDSTQTITYIKNVSNRKEYYVSFITWDDNGENKIYMRGIQEINPQETIEIDFKKIRDEQIPDEEGKTLPQNLTRGKITWMLRRNLEETEEEKVRVPLVGQMQQINADQGINLTYFCSICCTAGPFGTPAFTNGSVAPNNSTIEYGESKTFAAYEDGLDCYGQAFSSRVPNVFNIDWTSSNTNVATVSNNPVSNIAYTSSTGAGETEIKAAWWVDKYIPQIPGPGCFGGIGRNCVTCMETIEQVMPKADLTVQPKITIKRDNQPASGTQNVIIGQKMDLDAVVTGGTPSSKQWSIEGSSNQNTVNSKIIKDYNVICDLDASGDCQLPTSGTIDHVALTNPNLDFYWLDSGSSREAKYTVTVNGVQNSAAVNFDVKKPTVTVTRQQNGTANISVINGLFGLWLGKQTPAPIVPGITFTYTLDQMPSGFNGSFKWVQIWNKNRRVYAIGPGTWANSVASGIDTTYPYGSGTFEEDSPGIGLDASAYNQAEIDDSYNMYLMFTPNNPNSKEIPLKRVNWGWTAKAKIVSGTWQINGTPTKFANNPVNETSHPTWNTNPIKVGFQ